VPPLHPLKNQVKTTQEIVDARTRQEVRITLDSTRVIIQEDVLKECPGAFDIKNGTT